ncbi:hypothetical protein [Streptomyces sp. 5-6(2022)]|uniref:hypothetical protein n=1 Tax=Streptomyces sp. 5-6(2022) TaxID=2936510 RepID=UPI0023B9C4E7|nr:hypothetical protein [Streptomyces sp. 5-6(2022)]
MGVLHKHTIRGQINIGRDILRCPKCRRDKGLTIYGYRGKKPRVTCPCGHDGKAPGPFDQPWLLDQLNNTPAARSGTQWSVGRIPDPKRFD